MTQRHRVIRSQRRRTDWTVGPISNIQSVTATSAVLGTSFVVGTDEAGETLVRTRGSGLAFLTSATNAGDGYFGAFGIGLASAPAITAGIASLPTPITESDSDNWVYHQFFQLFAPHTIDGTASTDTADGPSWIRFEIDSKAMRKVSDSDVGLYMAWEFSETGTAAMSFTADCRMLTKLS